MTMTDWAEREIAAACKRENPEWDGESFDYGCACYQSALKAYKSLMEDGHSGFSFGMTKNILIKLLHQIPLSPITDEDFTIEDDESLSDSKYAQEKGLKSSIQCPRRSSLFREETLDGVVTYHDVDRVYCVNIDDPKYSYHCGLSKIVDELFPITMPYTPSDKKYKVNVQEFLLDPKNGDFDHQRVVSVVTPEGEEILINEPKYIQKEINGKMVQCSLDEWMKDYKQYVENFPVTVLTK